MIDYWFWTLLRTLIDAALFANDTNYCGHWSICARNNL